MPNILRNPNFNRGLARKSGVYRLGNLGEKLGILPEDEKDFKDYKARVKSSTDYYANRKNAVENSSLSANELQPIVPNTPLEQMTYICIGHDMHLQAYLKNKELPCYSITMGDKRRGDFLLRRSELMKRYKPVEAVDAWGNIWRREDALELKNDIIHTKT